MADERTYYVLCADNCKFESMTKEQILTAIEQAISTGTITNVDTGFITKIKEQNSGAALSFWVGTQAQYNALTEKNVNCFYIITDDTTADDMQAAMRELQNQNNDAQTKIADLQASIFYINSVIENAQNKKGCVLFDCGENYEYLATGKEIAPLTDYQLLFVKLSSGGEILCSVWNDTLNKKIIVRGTTSLPDGSTYKNKVYQYNIGIQINLETNIVEDVEVTRFDYQLDDNANVTGITYTSPSISKIVGIM